MTSNLVLVSSFLLLLLCCYVTQGMFSSSMLCFKIWFLGDGEFEYENIDRPLINHPFHTNLILHKVNKKWLLWVKIMNLQMEQELPIIFFKIWSNQACIVKYSAMVKLFNLVKLCGKISLETESQFETVSKKATWCQNYDVYL